MSNTGCPRKNVPFEEGQTSPKGTFFLGHLVYANESNNASVTDGLLILSLLSSYPYSRDAITSKKHPIVASSAILTFY